MRIINDLYNGLTAGEKRFASIAEAKGLITSLNSLLDSVNVTNGVNNKNLFEYTVSKLYETVMEGVLNNKK